MDTTETPTDLPEPEFKNEFDEVLLTLGAFKGQITLLQNQLKTLEKHVNKKVRIYKREAKKQNKKGHRKPSGFAVPTKITEELCEFMDKPKGTKMARTEVTQYIIEYIKENKLQQPDNKKFIAPDKRLDKLLSVPKGEKVTYFNIQRFMNKHFVKGA